MKTIRTRMAPSPTGDYHIGHIRTVLYNYVFAKKHSGKFVIRIEDTDRGRYVEGAIERILKVISDFGLDWDEGPFIQSERLDIYHKHVDELINLGKAYRCFCTKERLGEMRAEQTEKGYARTMYDGRCRELEREGAEKLMLEGVPYVVRLKVPKNERVKFFDEVYGALEFESKEIDDTVLLKSGGYPTYHLAVVVDDHLMKITHVMRGNDWLPSTPKHILLYQAFGWELPTFIHLPNLKEKGESKKLSKRYGAVLAVDFLREGYIVEAILNFLMFLGWNPGGDKEIYSLDEFVEVFDVKRVHKTDLVVFDREKLLWLNGYYLRSMSSEVFQKRILQWSENYSVDLHTGDHNEEYHLEVISLIKERIKTLAEFTSLTHYFYSEPNIDETLLDHYTKSKEKTGYILNGFVDLFKGVSKGAWKSSQIEKNAYLFMEQNDFGTKEALMTLRVAVTGEKATPPIFRILELLGREVVLTRLEKALSV